MRLWRNRQTRTFEGRMGNHPGSSPGNRTTHSKNRTFVRGPFFIFVRYIWWCGYRDLATAAMLRIVIRCTRLGEQLNLSYMRVAPPIAVKQVPLKLKASTSLFLWLSSAACRAPNPQSDYNLSPDWCGYRDLATAAMLRIVIRCTRLGDDMFVFLSKR